MEIGRDEILGGGRRCERHLRQHDGETDHGHEGRHQDGDPEQDTTPCSAARHVARVSSRLCVHGRQVPPTGRTTPAPPHRRMRRGRARARLVGAAGHAGGPAGTAGRTDAEIS